MKEPPGPPPLPGPSESRRKLRRGLVIAGGGAKGAYAAGCLKAFRDHGITFDAVSGTSSGALNAVTWSAEALDKGRDIWFHLSFQSVFPPVLQLPGPLNLLNYAWGLFRILFGVAETVVRGLPLPPDFQAARQTVAVVVTLVGGAPILVLGYLLSDRPLWALAILLIFLLSTRSSIKAYLSRNGEGVRAANGIFFASLWILTVVAIARAWSINPFTDWRFFLAFWAGVAAAAATVAFSDRLFGTIGASTVFRNDPLGQAIRGILDEHPLQVPTYVTVAERAKIFVPAPDYDWDKYLDEMRRDLEKPPPDDPSFQSHLPANAAGMKMAALRNFENGTLRFSEVMDNEPPSVTREWVPRYERLDTIPDPARSSSYALASAAIPLGLVGAINVGGAILVDGGIVDNLPLLPLMQHETLDEIFVISLKPETDGALVDSGELSMARLEELRALVAYHERGVPQTFGELRERLAEAGRQEASASEPLRRPLLRIFSPRRPLGGLLSGTLNFRAEYAQGLFADGERETRLRLNSATRASEAGQV